MAQQPSRAALTHTSALGPRTPPPHLRKAPPSHPPAGSGCLQAPSLDQSWNCNSSEDWRVLGTNPRMRTRVHARTQVQIHAHHFKQLQ